jgi:NADPH:quinone reductase-like Zn-dependent oxidoreductase
VEQVGSGVRAFKPGDEVYCFGHGAFAEHIAVLYLCADVHAANRPSSGSAWTQACPV